VSEAGQCDVVCHVTWPASEVIHLASRPLRRRPGNPAARAGADITMLSAPVALKIAGGSAIGRFTVRAGQHLVFALDHGQPGGPAPRLWRQAELAQRLDDTAAAWRSWSQLHQSYQGRGMSWSRSAAGCCGP